MHIAIYATWMRIGGAERVAHTLCEYLDEKGHEVDLVLVRCEGKLLEDLPESVSLVDLHSRRVSTSLIPLIRYLRQQNPDVLFSVLTENNILSTSAARLAKFEGRLILSEHNAVSSRRKTLKQRGTMWLASSTYPYSDQIIAVSEGVRNDLLKVMDLRGEHVSVIHNPVNIQSIRNRSREDINHKWLRDPSLSVILTAGRHAPQKGFDTLLRAFEKIQNSDLRLLILGEGEETERLIKLSRCLGISERVEFTGFVENPYKYFSNADLFVLSSWYEGFGLVIVEAMSVGCPIVSTDCPHGPSEILEKGKYGRLVPIREPHILAEAIVDELNNPTPENDLMTKANEFAVENVMKQYEDLFFS